MSIPLLNNPRILSDFLESNQKIVVPFFEELFQEAIADGSIKNIKYPELLSSLFVLVMDVWLIPSIFPCNKEQLIEKLYFIKEMFEKLDIPVIDEEILELSKQMIECIKTE